MQLGKFLKRIDSSWLGKVVSKKQNIIIKTDPDRIFVENVRSFFNIKHSFAKLLCEAAVKEKVFKKQIGLECPHDKNILKSYNVDEKLDDSLECTICLALEREQYIYQLKDLIKITYYQLKRKNASN